MATLRLFAQARELAGTGSATVPGSTVGEVLDAAVEQFGVDFAAIVSGSRVWLNGAQADRGDTVQPADEVAILPPVSGG